jgi:hypothetical protein
MVNDDFLFSLILNSGHRGRHFALKADEVDGVVDNWIYLLSGISPERQKQGGFTERRLVELDVTAGIINRLPVFAEESSGGPIVRYFVERKYPASESRD